MTPCDLEPFVRPRSGKAVSMHGFEGIRRAAEDYGRRERSIQETKFTYINTTSLLPLPKVARATQLPLSTSKALG